MRCFCARKQLDPERANFVFQGQPCCNFACYAQAELVAKEKNANQRTDGTAPARFLCCLDRPNGPYNWY